MHGSVLSYICYNISSKCTVAAHGFQLFVLVYSLRVLTPTCYIVMEIFKKNLVEMEILIKCVQHKFYQFPQSLFGCSHQIVLIILLILFINHINLMLNLAGGQLLLG